MALKGGVAAMKADLNTLNFVYLLCAELSSDNHRRFLG